MKSGLQGLETTTPARRAADLTGPRDGLLLVRHGALAGVVLIVGIVLQYIDDEGTPGGGAARAGTANSSWAACSAGAMSTSPLRRSSHPKATWRSATRSARWPLTEEASRGALRRTRPLTSSGSRSRTWWATGRTSVLPSRLGLEPYPDNWRAQVRRPETLPHYPMVLHRGGYPDGS